MKLTKSLFSLVVILLTQACATYYQMNYEFNRNFETGDLEEADRILASNEKAEKGKAKFLYYANRGVVNSLLGNYVESNEYLEKAYLFGEDYHQNYLNVALSMVSNPSVIEYPGEDHEHLLVLYYKALNWLKLGDKDAALVECRRLNTKLNQLSDRYTKDFKYDEDAFIHNLMGIIYDANADYNNAFIAYRNAYRIYTEDYVSEFNLKAPEQLKDDLIRTAYLMGFDDEVGKYEKLFGRKYKPDAPDGGYLVFFWNDGLGPVKSEWSINFSVVHGSGGVVTFVNDEYGFNFPFPISSVSDDDKNGLENLEFFRIAFPKYQERPKLYDQGRIFTNNRSYELEQAEDINAIAFKVLEQRMLAEFGKSLLRFAIKKASEQALRKENEGLGTALGFINAISEKADTRNWQSIPSSIYYTRVPLKQGTNEIKFQVSATGNPEVDSYKFDYVGEQGRTQFHAFHSLEISPKYMSRGY